MQKLRERAHQILVYQARNEAKRKRKPGLFLPDFVFALLFFADALK